MVADVAAKANWKNQDLKPCDSAPSKPSERKKWRDPTKRDPRDPSPGPPYANA